MQQAGEPTRTAGRLPERAITSPDIITFTELVVQPDAPFILARDGLGRVHSVEGSVPHEIRGGKKRLGVLHQVLVDHAGGNLVARRARALNITRCWERVAGSVAHKRLIAETCGTGAICNNAERIKDLARETGQITAELRG